MNQSFPAQNSDFRESNRDAQRHDLFALLGFLLKQPPSAVQLASLAVLTLTMQTPAFLVDVLCDLQAAAGRYDARSVKREYEDLFVGMGRGEVVPYASWYAEKLLMAGPLVRLRTDLRELNIARRAGVCEPEDHAAALCEAMVLILDDGRLSVRQQASFFSNHLATWMIRFFQDLQKAHSAAFYRYVGRLGEQFFLLEKQLLQTTSF